MKVSWTLCVTSKFHIALCGKIIPSLIQVLGQTIPNPCCSFARELKYFGYVAIPICGEVHADGRFCASSTEIQCHTLPISFMSLLITISRKSNSKKKKIQRKPSDCNSGIWPLSPKRIPHEVRNMIEGYAKLVFNNASTTPCRLMLL